MIKIGNYKKLSISGWFLAAVLLLGYNGYKVMTLIDPVLTGRSAEVRLASEKWQAYETVTSAAISSVRDMIDLDIVSAKFTPGLQVKEKNSCTSKKLEIEKEPEIRLPTLNGLMEVLDTHGDMKIFAVIDGETHTEHDQVRGFTVKRISRNGVILTKAGKGWLIPAPNAYFSMDQGE